MLAITAARAMPIVRVAVPGETELDVPVPAMFRALSQKVNVICILAVLILGSGLLGERWIPHWMFLFSLVAVAAIAMAPARYQFTTSGVSPNAAVFRPWSDFDRWEAM